MTPRASFLPYARQSIDDDDVAAVVAALRGDWLTTGPTVAEFERAFAAYVGAEHAVAVSNGTAALHATVDALRIGPGDEVIVPALTFAASANCVLYAGGTPVFADVDPETLLIDPASVEARLTPRTRAIVTVDYAGQPCDYDAIGEIARARGLAVIADACHAVGASWRGRPVGTLADLSTFSFHPAKHLTTAEGGMITTADAALAQRMRVFRNHGITTDHAQRSQSGTFAYEMTELGYNYRLSDLQCALGISQLRKLPSFLARRRALAAAYDAGLADVRGLRPLAVRPGLEHAYHLYVVQLDEPLGARRDEVYAGLRRANVGANVHYVPVHLHPYYRERLGTGPGLCPAAEAAYRRILTLPLFPEMSEQDVLDVVAACRAALDSRLVIT